MEQTPEILSPIGHGWKMEGHDDDSPLVINWMDGKPAPQALLDFLACTCRVECKLPHCACMKNGLKCTEMCTLSNCANWSSEEEDEEEEECNEDADDADDIDDLYYEEAEV